MGEQIDGGPAFPCSPCGSSFTGPDGYTSWQFPGATGMTLRDWFAGQSLAGVWAGRESDYVKLEAPTASDVAASAYRIADAMLAECEKNTKGDHHAT